MTFNLLQENVAIKDMKGAEKPPFYFTDLTCIQIYFRTLYMILQLQSFLIP